MSLKLSILLQAIDRISGPAKRVQQAAQRMGDGVRQAGQKIERASSPMDRFSGKVDGLRSRLLGALVAVNRASGPNGLDLLGRASDKAGYAVGSLMRKMAGLTVTAAEWGATAGVAAGGYALFDLFRTAGEFEELNLSLENTLGSAAKAKDAMSWVQKFAETTPYQLAEVADAYANMVNATDPKNGILLALGDAAAARRKTLEQATEMFLDAQMFQFERMLEFGVRASQAGDQVTFSFAKNGKQLQRTVARDSAAVTEALKEIFSLLYGGTMVKKSGGLFGIIGNLRDQWSRFLLMVADAGIFDLVKAKLEGIYARVKQMSDDGRLAAWAEKISDKLESVVEWADQFTAEDFDAVINDMERLASAAGRFADAILSVDGALTKIKRVGANITYGLDWLVWGSKDADTQWEKMYPDEKRRKSPREKRREIFNGVGLNGFQPGMRLPVPDLPRARVPNSGKQPAASRPTDVGGKIELKVSSDPGTRVSLQRYQSKDIPWSIQIARSNWTPA
jgi:hypothetical protein